MFNRSKNIRSSSSKNSRQQLKKLVPLNMLPDSDLVRLLEHAKFEQLQSGEYLFQQGETKSQNVYLINGSVALLADGNEVDTVVAGSDTARFPLAHQIPRKNAARAMSQVECVRIDTHQLSDLLANTGDESTKSDAPDATSADDWMTQLLQSKVFQQIPAANIQSVMMRMEEVQVITGDEVICQGDSGDYFYLIHQGRCSVTKWQNRGEEADELAQLGPGDSFGEEALLSDSPRGSSVTMLSDGVLLRLSKEDFIEFVKRPLAHSISYEEGVSRVEQGAVWLDARSAVEYEQSHIKGSINLPSHLVRYQAATMAPNRQYIAYCQTGQQSATAAFLLIELGFEISVLGDGGFSSVPEDGLTNRPHMDDDKAKVISLESGEELSSGEKSSAVGVDLKALQVKLHQLQGDKKRTTVKWLTERKTLKMAISKAQLRFAELEKAREVAEATTQQAEEQLAISVQQRDELQSEMEELQADLKAGSVGSKESVKQLKQLSKQQVEVTKERDEARSGLEQLQIEVAAHSAAAQESVDKLQQLSQQQVEAIKERDEARSELEKLQIKATVGDAKVKESREQLQQLLQQQVETAQERDEARSELEQIKVEASSSGDRETGEKLQRLLQKQAETTEERDEARGALGRLQSEVAASNTIEQELHEQIGQLQHELATIAQEKVEERDRLEQLQSEIAAGSTAEQEAQAQIDRLKQELAVTIKERAKEQGRLDRLQEEMAASSAEPKGSGKLAKKLQRELDIITPELERMRSMADKRGIADEARINYLTEELNGLRTQLIQLSNTEQEASTVVESEELEALRTEMEFVRSQAASDMSVLQGRLAETEARLVKRDRKSGNGEGEMAAAKQDIKRLERAVAKRQKRVEQAADERQQLEEGIEERERIIKQLQSNLGKAQVEAEEAGYSCKEAEDARTQVEAALYTLKQELEEESAFKKRADTHFQDSSQALDLSNVTGKRISIKSIMLGVLVGVGLLFILLEGFMLASGRGELIATLRGSSNQPAVEQQKRNTRGARIDRQGGTIVRDSAQPDANKKSNGKRPSSGVVTGTLLRGADIGPLMLLIAGGEFTMGSDRNQISADERPAHQVVLSDFAISRNEVTFEEYDRFAEATGRKLPDDNGWGRGKRPVINVNWADASAYARWLAAGTRKRYRLPTEAEWEYAAAGGSDRVYWWGYQVDKGRANCFDCGSSWDRKSTAPVGRFGPNGFGLHDTAGNAREWVRDCYHDSYAGAPTDGSAWEEVGCKERVVRGGAYDKAAETMRSTWRGHLKADTNLPMLGFRLVMDL